MRILRGKSNLEVSSQGFALFVVGLVLATFIGGAVRTLLSSDGVHKQIVSQIKTMLPNHTFNIDRTQVLLSRGAWPGLGVRIYGLTLNQDVCGKLSFKLAIPEVTLPLSLWSLMRGHLRLADVEIPKGAIHLDYRPCGDAKAAAQAAPGGDLAPSINVPKVKPEELRKFVTSFQLNDFAVTYEKQPTWKLVFNSVELEAGDETSLQATVDVQKSLTFGALTHQVELEAHTDGQVLNWDINTEFKEGHLQITGALDQTTQAAHANLGLQQVPLKDFLSEMYQAGFLDHELKLKAAWVSCSAEWEGSLNQVTATPASVHDCKVEGAYGRADLDKTEVWLNSGQPFKQPAHFKIRALQIQALLEALNREVLPAVVSKLGVWSGNIDYTSAKAWQLDGHLENAEIVFSNQSVRGKQGIDKLHTQIKILDGEVHGRVDEMAIHQGEFAGLLEFALDDEWRNGKFKASVERVSLSPPIQKLMVGGALGAAAVQGEGALSNGELADWNGTLDLPELSGLGWKSEGVKVKSLYRPGTFTLETTVKKTSVTPSWRYYGSLKPLIGELPGPVEWKDLVTKVDIVKGGGHIQSATAQLETLNQPWSGRGQWVRDGELSGFIKLGRVRPQTFSVRGEKGILNIGLKAAGT